MLPTMPHALAVTILLMLAATAGAALATRPAASLIRHKRLGESVGVWRDGRVVIVPPDQINIPDAEGPNG
jgi:hypothetical protein